MPCGPARTFPLIFFIGSFNKYPQKEDFTEIENLTGKNQKQIRKWFENRRFSEQN